MRGTEDHTTTSVRGAGRFGGIVARVTDRTEGGLTLIYVAWAMLSVFVGADQRSPLSGFRLPDGDHLNELMRVEAWFLGAAPITGHPSTVGVSGPGPWYLYVTSLPTRFLGPLMGGNYTQAAMLVNILLCAGLLFCAMRMARELAGGALGPLVLFSATTILSQVHHRISPSPLMTRPATVGYYATLCLVLGVLTARRAHGERHLLPATFSAVLLFHSYIMNIPFVIIVGSLLLGPVLRGARRGEQRAILSVVLVFVGAAQTVAGWVIAPETLRFYFAGSAAPDGTDLVRNDLLGTFTTTRPLYSNEIRWWPPSVELARLQHVIGGHIVWLVGAILVGGVIMLLVTAREPLAGSVLFLSWLYWSYLSLNPYLVENNAYALTPAAGIGVSAGVVVLMLRRESRHARYTRSTDNVDGDNTHAEPVPAGARQSGSGHRTGALLAAVLSLAPIVVAVTYRGSYWYSGRGQFFTLHLDQGDLYQGMARQLRDRYGEGRTYALQLDDVDNRIDGGANYRGAAAAAWLALNLQGEHSCILLQPHHQRNEALSLAAVVGTKGLCERSSMGSETVELKVIRGTGQNPNSEPVFVSANQPEERRVQAFPATGGVTLAELLGNHPG